ncbi:MAG TPA: tetratricopeptide repeat protein [Anaerolineales bacterium]|nr:tetratricopeptide repeat protein [Anaerolineales bacterium]
MKLKKLALIALPMTALMLASWACTLGKSPSAKALEAAQTAVAGADDTTAITQFQAVLVEEGAKDEEKVAAYQGLAGIYEGQDDYAQAVKAYDNLLTLQPENYDALQARGKAHLQLGNYEQAISDLKGSLQGDVANADGYYDIGQAYLNLGEYDDAIENYTLALDNSSDTEEQADILAQRCFAKSELGDANGAMEDCNAAIDKNANLAIAYAYRSDLHSELGDDASAISDAELAVSMGSDLSDGTRSALQHSLALAQLNTGDYENCISNATGSIELEGADSPDAARTYGIRGECYLQLDDAKSALADFEQAIELGKTDVPALSGFYLKRARAYSELGEDALALADAEAAAGIATDDVDAARAYNTMGDIYYYQKDYVTAEAKYLQASALRSDYALYYENLGWAQYYQDGREIDAIASFTIAIELEPESPYSYLGRGYTHYALGNTAEARADLEKVLTFDVPESTIENVNEALGKLP